MKKHFLSTFGSMSQLLIVVTVVAISVFISLSAKADHYGDDAELFSKALSRALSEGVLDANSNAEVKIQEIQVPEKLLPRFRYIAESQAMIWADTILEGDYYADTAVVIDRIEGLFRNDELVAYRITYSSKAWMTADCGFDGRDRSLLADCTQGRIQESSLVSPALTSWTRDPNAYARFIETEPQS